MKINDGWIYYKDKGNKNRYLLGQPGSKTLCCFGINPSTAEPSNLDNTVTSVSNIAKKKGFDGWIMFNIYPQRATNPNDMDVVFNKKEHAKNISHIKLLLSEFENLTFWAAWGTLIKKREYLTQCLLDIQNVTNKQKIPWISMGKLSKDGHPHHPLYLNHSSSLDKFDLSKYISLLEK